MNDVTVLIERLCRAFAQDDQTLGSGAREYGDIQANLRDTPDVTTAPEFQRRFRAFYQVRRDPDWQRFYFDFMQKHRADRPNFKETLDALAQPWKHCEASFASKLVATLNAELPVLDSRVLAVMRAHLADRGKGRGEWKLLRAGSLDRRLQRALFVYDCLTATARQILDAPKCADLIALFDKSCGQHPISAAKKLDLMLWRYGARLLSSSR